MKPKSIAQGRIRVLDGWRGLAILTVLAGHFLLPFTALGRLGVEFFFVLSGRLMADILFLQDTRLKYFFMRRFARVWPALAVFVIVIGLIGLAIPIFRFEAIDWVASLTFWANYLFALGERIPTLGHLWSLCIEEHAYVMLGIVALTARKFKINVTVFLCAISCLAITSGVIQMAYGGTYYSVYWRTDARVSSIIMSSAVYMILPKISLKPWLKQFGSPFSLVIGSIIILAPAPLPVKYSVGSFLLAYGVCTVEASDPRFQWILSHPLMVLAGMWSYSLYLWQQPWHTLERVTPWWCTPLLGIPAVATGIAGYYLAERPLRRFLHRKIGAMELREAQRASLETARA